MCWQQRTETKHLKCSQALQLISLWAPLASTICLIISLAVGAGRSIPNRKRSPDSASPNLATVSRLRRTRTHIGIEASLYGGPTASNDSLRTDFVVI